MKVLILAGGLGTRLSEETSIRPKPMVEIGNKPMLWHIMKIYSFYGFNEFIILLGYKGYYIKEYFTNYFLHQSDVTMDLKNNKMEIHKSSIEPWKVTLLDTGIDTMTGGRIKRAKEYINNETFMLTYGDGLADVNIKQLLAFHKKNAKSITMTTIQPEGKYGSVQIDDNNLINEFVEKPKTTSNWINGGFFVCEPEIIDYIADDTTAFEKEPLIKMAKNQIISAYKHQGFWFCMDTLRDKMDLNKMWKQNKSPWKVW
ncbi:MAG: glucose-1-phosphate cytidylyltransferase [Spirochaetes bacterium]|nr:glucose-1-phosphate cytidylyltransferase [Spirochaetota bacterium]